MLNAVDFGIPQNRTRLYIVGFKQKTNFCFPVGEKTNKTMFDFLEDNVDAKYYLRYKGFRFVTKNSARAKVNEPIIRTQKANQQFNWNGNFYFQPLSSIKNRQDILERAHVGKFNNQTGVIRLLTPRECLRLMGFDDSFKIVVPNVHAYRQSGNSIVVNVLQEILKSICETGVFNDE